ncbi:MAG: hypothetical protein ABI615_03075 [Chthoniobacterales bacterium]
MTETTTSGATASDEGEQKSTTRYRYYQQPPKTIFVKWSELVDLVPPSILAPGDHHSQLTVGLPSEEIFEGIIPRIRYVRLMELLPEGVFRIPDDKRDEFLYIPASRIARHYQLATLREALPEEPKPKPEVKPTPEIKAPEIKVESPAVAPPVTVPVFSPVTPEPPAAPVVKPEAKEDVKEPEPAPAPKVILPPKFEVKTFQRVEDKLVTFPPLKTPEGAAKKEPLPEISKPFFVPPTVAPAKPLEVKEEVKAVVPEVKAEPPVPAIPDLQEEPPKAEVEKAEIPEVKPEKPDEPLPLPSKVPIRAPITLPKQPVTNLPAPVLPSANFDPQQKRRLFDRLPLFRKKAPVPIAQPTAPIVGIKPIQANLPSRVAGPLPVKAFSPETPLSPIAPPAPASSSPVIMPSNEESPAERRAKDEIPNQEALQTLFMTDEALTIERTMELCSGFPGIQSCILARGAGVIASANVPNGIDVITLSTNAMAMLRQMQDSFQKMGVGAIPAVTLHSEKGPISVLPHEDLCLLILHKDRAFIPGVRERLQDVMHQLSQANLPLSIQSGSDKDSKASL